MNRKINFESRPNIFFALHFNATVMRLNKKFGQVQAQARSGDLGRRVVLSTVKTRKKSFTLFGGHANSLIADENFDFVAHLARFDRDF